MSCTTIRRAVRAVLLKKSLDAFWIYSSATWAGWFLAEWCIRAMRSRLEPMKRFAKTLRRHRPLLVNWFAAKGEIALGGVEGPYPYAPRPDHVDPTTGRRA